MMGSLVLFVFRGRNFTGNFLVLFFLLGIVRLLVDLDTGGGDGPLGQFMRTRSSLVSITIVLPVTNTTRPMMPPMVVMVSPFLTLSRISWACFFLLFSGRIRMK